MEDLLRDLEMRPNRALLKVQTILGAHKTNVKPEKHTRRQVFSELNRKNILLLRNEVSQDKNEEKIRIN